MEEVYNHVLLFSKHQRVFLLRPVAFSLFDYLNNV